MAKKFLKAAIKHPGREIERAKENGVSVHQQLEKDSHSKNASLRGAGNLGLRFEKGGDLHRKRGKKKSKIGRGRVLYDHNGKKD